MLLDKPLDANDIVSVKLGNGDEIIAKVLAVDAEKITVSKPLLMILSQDPRSGAPGVQMAPFWMMGADPAGKFTISKTHVVCLVKANIDAAKSYLAQTTGLTIPSAGSGLIT
jgi:hypothetical protein